MALVEFLNNQTSCDGCEDGWIYEGDQVDFTMRKPCWVCGGSGRLPD